MNMNQIEVFDPSTEIEPIENALLKGGSEHTVALAFAQRYTDRLIFDHHSNNWFEWTGQYWAAQKMGLVSHYCRNVASTLVGGKQAEKRSFASGVEWFCKNDPTFARSSNMFDSDRYLLNCPDGTYDLRTGGIKEHDPKDLITNITNVAPGDGYGFRFPQFLQEITLNDDELMEFLQIALGACLSGAVENHWLMFWIGNGRNGKNTLGDAVMRVMGTYARKIPSSTLLKSKHDGHPTEIANLLGCRLAVASEVDSSSFWSENRINELTGDAKLSARFMRGDLFEFDRTFKLLIYGNHRPRLSSVTEAMNSRIKMVRFGANFTGRGDPDLPEKLSKEDPNILRWLLDGHIKWMTLGKRLPRCDVVEAEIQDYMSSQSTPFNWMDETLEPSDVNWELSTSLYQSYKDWKLNRGEQPQGQTQWGEEMSKRFHKKKGNKGIIYGVIKIGFAPF